MAHFSVSPGKSVKTIEEGCNLFGESPQMRGFTPRPGIILSNPQFKGRVTLWFPNVDNNYWDNNLTSFPNLIVETPKDMFRNDMQFNKYVEKGEIRVTFLKNKKMFKDTDYHFIGIYVLNKKESITFKPNCCVWECILEKCDDDQNELYKLLVKEGFVF